MWGILPSRGVWIFFAVVRHLGMSILELESRFRGLGIGPADAQTYVYVCVFVLGFR